MSSSTPIPFGLNPQGRMVTAADVPRGLQCGCVCPKCHGHLVAKQGDVRAHHFSHHDARECQGAFETAVHRMAKQLILEHRGLCIPEQVITEKAIDDSGKEHQEEERLAEVQWLSFDRVELEKTLGEWRPDAIGYVGDTAYCLEVMVTHATTKPKQSGLREKNVFAIEISVGDVDFGDEPYKRLKEVVIDRATTKRWFSYPPAAGVREQVKKRLDAKIKAANERLRAAQQPRPPKPHAAPPARRVVQEPEPAPPREEKHYSHRILFCTQCRHLWEVPIKDMPPPTGELPCPECGGVVSCRKALDLIRSR